MYGDPDFLESYEGSREFDEMYSFALTSLKAVCSPKNLDECTDEQKTKLEDIIAMSLEDLEKSIAEFDEKFEELEDHFESSTEVLEEEYNEMVEVNKNKKNSAKDESNYNILKSIQTLREMKNGGNDEL